MEKPIMNKCLRIFLAIITFMGSLTALAAFPGAPASAQQGSPDATGRIGPRALSALVARDGQGNLYAVSKHPSAVIYNSSPTTSVYKSSDGGQNWRAMGDYATATGPSYSDPMNLAVSANGSVVLLSVRSGQGFSMLKSNNSGATWTLLPGSNLFSQGFIANLVIDPVDTNKVYASLMQGFYRSTDGGATWLLMTGASLPESYQPGLIAVDPANSAHLLAATNGIVRVSTDYGATWQGATGEIPNVNSYQSLLMFVPRPGGQSIALASDFDLRKGVLVSKDGGLTWKRSTGLPPGLITGMDYAQDRIYVHVAGGLSTNEQPTSFTDTRLYSSMDGDNWSLISRQPIGVGIDSMLGYVPFNSNLHASRTDPQRLFRDDGTFSTNGGRTWTQRPSSGLPLTELSVYNITTEPEGWLATSGQSLYRSADAGQNWDLLFADSSNADRSITGMISFGNTILLHLKTQPGSINDKILRSTNNGLTWDATSVGVNTIQTRFTLVRAGAGTVYAAASPNYFDPLAQGGGLFKSTDGGATWTNPLPTGLPVNNVLVDPANSNHLWAAGELGIVESKDAGAHWIKLETKPRIGGLIFGEEGSSTVLYAYETKGESGNGNGPQHGALYKSTDAGRNWIAISLGNVGPQDYSVQKFEATGKGHLVVAWGGQPSIFSESLDGGRTWRILGGRTVGDAFSYPPYGSIAIDASGAVLAAGSNSKLTKLETGLAQPPLSVNTLPFEPMTVADIGPLYTSSPIFRQLEVSGDWVMYAVGNQGCGHCGSYTTQLYVQNVLTGKRAKIRTSAARIPHGDSDVGATNIQFVAPKLRWDQPTGEASRQSQDFSPGDYKCSRCYYDLQTGQGGAYTGGDLTPEPLGDWDATIVPGPAPSYNPYTFKVLQRSTHRVVINSKLGDYIRPGTVRVGRDKVVFFQDQFTPNGGSYNSPQLVRMAWLLPPYPAFGKVWAKADEPVASGKAKRSWLWGPTPNGIAKEPYAEGPGDTRLVQYYDKSRMEVNDPNGNPNDPYYITNGLLATEMIGSEMQMGNNIFISASVPCTIPVAGDPRKDNPLTPSYSTLRGVTSIHGENQAKDRTGQAVGESLDVNGVVGSNTAQAKLAKYVAFAKETGHNVPDVFWKYLTSMKGTYGFDWTFVLGYPITEAYWTKMRVGGKDYPVMIQAYQRRVLTYVPAFAPEWQVQQGNVGQHYYEWRYTLNTYRPFGP